MFRSLNEYSNKILIDCMRQSGYLMLPSRQIYIYDQALNLFQKKHNYEIDCKLLEKTPLKYVAQGSIEEKDIKRIVKLYHVLYIEKYSIHNL